MFHQFTQLKRDVLSTGTASVVNELSVSGSRQTSSLQPTAHPLASSPAANISPHEVRTASTGFHAVSASRNVEGEKYISTSERSGSGAGTESLSDMIKVMEEKLQRIRLPAK